LTLFARLDDEGVSMTRLTAALAVLAGALLLTATAGKGTSAVKAKKG
jgi:hypothetical protein